jgi:hypothetical protein
MQLGHRSLALLTVLKRRINGVTKHQLAVRLAEDLSYFKRRHIMRGHRYVRGSELAAYGFLFMCGALAIPLVALAIMLYTTFFRL